MAASKPMIVTLTLVVILSAIVVGYLFGYFAHAKLKNSDESEVEAHREDGTIYNHSPGPCHLVNGIDYGAEDMELLPSGMVIISSGLRVLLEVTPDNWQKNIGRIKLFDFNQQEDGATVLPWQFPGEADFDTANFNPHGISAFHETHNDKLYVFVINHGYLPAMKEAVEIFQLVEVDGVLTLVHQRTLVDDEHFLMLNDIVATGPDTFFFTNFHSTRVVSEQMEEMSSGAKKASIGYYDGTRGKLLVEEQAGSNGIDISADGQYIYVDQFAGSAVSIFQRTEDNELHLIQDYVLDTGTDNVMVQGNYLWLGCQQKPSQALKYLNDPENETAPAQVMRLKVEDGQVTEAIEVYANDGSQISTSTVAVYYKDALLIGSVRTTALYCQVAYIG